MSVCERTSGAVRVHSCHSAPRTRPRAPAAGTACCRRRAGRCACSGGGYWWSGSETSSYTSISCRLYWPTPSDWPTATSTPTATTSGAPACSCCTSPRSQSPAAYTRSPLTPSTTSAASRPITPCRTSCPWRGALSSCVRRWVCGLSLALACTLVPRRYVQAHGRHDGHHRTEPSPRPGVAGRLDGLQRQHQRQRVIQDRPRHGIGDDRCVPDGAQLLTRYALCAASPSLDCSAMPLRVDRAMQDLLHLPPQPPLPLPPLPRPRRPPQPRRRR